MKPVTAFDADVLIYAATQDVPTWTRIRSLFAGVESAGIGSVLLLLEVLTKPMRSDPASAEAAALTGLLSRLDLRPLDQPTARIALSLSVSRGLRSADAVHLATAVAAGAGRFLTNNRRDFPQTISEIDIVYPEDLPIS